jgi:hypothetical protein
MVGFAADHHSQGDIGVQPAAAAGKGNRPWYLKCARNRHGFVLMASGVQNCARAFEEQVVEMGVETRLDDENPCHLQASAHGIGRSPTIESPYPASATGV